MIMAVDLTVSKTSWRQVRLHNEMDYNLLNMPFRIMPMNLNVH